MLTETSLHASAVADVPLYSGLARAPDDWIELAQFPVLERASLTGKFPSAWLSGRLIEAIERGAVEYASTSGSSGERLQLVRPPHWWLEEYRRTYAHHPRLRGFDPSAVRKAVLTTSVCSAQVCWRTNPSYVERQIGNTLYLNTTSDPNTWRRSDVERIVAELDEFQPYYLDVHAGYGAILARKAAQLGVAAPSHRPSVLTVSYDFATAASKVRCTEFFGAPAQELFGATEFGYLFMQTEHGLQTLSELAHLELVPLTGRPDIARLRVTSLKNDFMPLVRYAPGDLLEVRPDAAGKPRAYALAGREKELTIDAHGRALTALDLDRALFAADSSLDQYQLHASGAELRLDVVCDGEPSATLRDALRAVYGRDAELRAVQAIAPEPSGKFRLVRVHTKNHGGT
jgi:phenylacetate-CoA ligase